MICEIFRDSTFHREQSARVLSCSSETYVADQSMPQTDARLHSSRRRGPRGGQRAFQLGPRRLNFPRDSSWAARSRAVALWSATRLMPPSSESSYLRFISDTIVRPACNIARVGSTHANSVVDKAQTEVNTASSHHFKTVSCKNVCSTVIMPRR